MFFALFVLAVIYFFMDLYLKIQYGPDHILWPVLIFSVIYFGVAVTTRAFDSFALMYLPLVIASLLAFVAAFFIRRKKGGNVILTYKRNARNIAGIIAGGALILFMGYFISIPNVRAYPGGDLIYNEIYFQERLPMSIFIGLAGIAYISLIFRKGEFFEKGFATPDLKFYLWNGYQSYKWFDDVNKKEEERFSLVLSGNKGISHSVHGFSESTKNTLDEVLKQNFPNQSRST